MENVMEGKDIDLFSLPVPRWHEDDGGRYLGTAHVVITRDIDEGWVNLGCYRVMVHDHDALVAPLYIFRRASMAGSCAKSILIKEGPFRWLSASVTIRCWL